MLFTFYEVSHLDSYVRDDRPVASADETEHLELLEKPVANIRLKSRIKGQTEYYSAASNSYPFESVLRV